MKKTLVAIACLAWLASAAAEITVGVSVSTTGPGTSLGVPVSNTFGILPKTLGSEPVRYILLDDTSDPTAGAKIARQFATRGPRGRDHRFEHRARCDCAGGVAGETRVPLIALCPIPIDPAKQPFAFAVPQPISLMTDAVVEHMRANNVKTVGFIGFADAWGDLTLKSISASSEPGRHQDHVQRALRPQRHLDLRADAEDHRGRPGRGLRRRSGHTLALPQIAALERAGYRKPLYHTHGVVNRDFIRVGGKSVEGAIAPTGPVVVAEQLPADHPLKTVGLEFLKRYEAAYGAGSRNAFAAYAYDAVTIITAAVPGGVEERESPVRPNSAKRCATRSRA